MRSPLDRAVRKHRSWWLEACGKRCDCALQHSAVTALAAALDGRFAARVRSLHSCTSDHDYDLAWPRLSPLVRARMAEEEGFYREEYLS